jgi:hypothetical protein
LCINWAAIEWGNVADWVSGLGSFAAALVAVGGYRWSERQRQNSEREREQAAAYQICSKLSDLASDAHTTLGSLCARENAAQFWLTVSDPIEIVSAQAPIIDTPSTNSHSLIDVEQNLLLSMKEEDFLMDYSEAVKRNEVIKRALQDYASRYQFVFSMLPKPRAIEGEAIILDSDAAELKAVYPYALQAASVVQQARRLSIQNTEVLDRLATNFHPMMTKHFPNLHIPRLEMTPKSIPEEKRRKDDFDA